MKAKILLVLIAVAALGACGSTTENKATDSAMASTTVSESAGGMGPGSGMMARHHASVPQPYAGLANPVAADGASLEQGEELYSTYCASCHGDGGMGDGPAGVGLDPAPSPVAHTSQMLGDNFLFWRISEGGAMSPFSSAMPAWKDSLDEQSRWNLVNYVRALGSGRVTPRQGVGGVTYDPEMEQAQRADMLARAIEQEVITPDEAELFDTVHTAMDELIASGAVATSGSMEQMRQTMMTVLAEQGAISQTEAEAFNNIHDRLVAAGLMQ